MVGIIANEITLSFTDYERLYDTTYSVPVLLKTLMIFSVLVTALRMLFTSTQKTRYSMLSVLSVVKMDNQDIARYVKKNFQSDREKWQTRHHRQTQRWGPRLCKLSSTMICRYLASSLSDSYLSERIRLIVRPARGRDFLNDKVYLESMNAT